MCSLERNAPVLVPAQCEGPKKMLPSEHLYWKKLQPTRYTPMHMLITASERWNSDRLCCAMPLYPAIALVGSGFKLGYNRLHYTPQALREFNTSIFSGSPLIQLAEFNLMLLNFSSKYSWQFPVLEKKGWQGYLGPWAQGFGNMRFALQNVNNILDYDAGLDLGVTGRLAYKFKPGRQEFILTQQLRLPLASGFVRPLYTFTGPIMVKLINEVSILQFGTLNRRFGWMYKASLDLYRNRKRKKQVTERVPYRISLRFPVRPVQQAQLLPVGDPNHHLFRNPQILITMSIYKSYPYPLS